MGTARKPTRLADGSITLSVDDWRDRAIRAEAERDSARIALRNVLALSHRMRKADRENAAHLVRFCASAGVVPQAGRA